MKLSIPTLLATISILIAAPLSTGNAQNAAAGSKPASEGLQGAWEGVEIGREAEGKCTMIISGDTIHFQGAKKEEWYKAEFDLPSGSDPKQMRAIIKEAPAPDFIGKTSLAIYKIEGRKLTLVGNAPGSTEAPSGFDDTDKTRRFVFSKAETK